MRRNITIILCLAILSLAGFVAWIYVKHSDQSGAPTPQQNVSDGRTNNKLPDSDEKTMTSVVFDLPVHVAFFGDNDFSPCYFDQEKKTLYRWKEVALRREQLLQTPYGGLISGIEVLEAKDFSVQSVEAPVKYWQSDDAYRPGYLDKTIWTFYAWRGVLLKKQELLDDSQNGRPALVKPASPSQHISLLEIDMPAHLKDHPELWKKT